VAKIDKEADKKSKATFEEVIQKLTHQLAAASPQAKSGRSRGRGALPGGSDVSAKRSTLSAEQNSRWPPCSKTLHPTPHTLNPEHYTLNPNL
jgi:hypothetical protein